MLTITANPEPNDNEQRALILGAAIEVMSLAETNLHRKIQALKNKHPHTYPFRRVYWNLCHAWYECVSTGDQLDKKLKELS